MFNLVGKLTTEFKSYLGRREWHSGQHDCVNISAIKMKKKKKIPSISKSDDECWLKINYCHKKFCFKFKYPLVDYAYGPEDDEGILA